MLEAAYNSWAHDARNGLTKVQNSTRPARFLSMAACLLQLALSMRSGGI